MVAHPGGFGPVVDGTYLPHDPFDPTAPAISENKPLMVGANRDEMAFFYWERKASDLFTLTDDGLKSQLDKDFGGNAETILAMYRKTRPGASPSDLYIAITTSALCGSAPLNLPRRSSHRKRRLCICTCSLTNQT
jgi:para-nitrobenzyl esterase